MDDKPLFGIWIPGEGWLKAKEDFYADTNKVRALEVARNIGKRARVYYADPNIMEELQNLYLQKESRSLCRYFSNLFKPKKNR